MWSLTSMGDTGNGFLAAIAICQALFERETTGRGQFCETAIVNAQLLNSSHAIVHPDGTPFERPLLDAMQTGFSAGVRLYPTKDGWLCLSLMNDRHWHALASAMDLPDLAAGARLGDSGTRAVADEEISKLVENRLVTASATQWMATLDAAGVPCEASPDDASIRLWQDPQFARQGYVSTVSHPMAGELGQPGLAFQFSDTKTGVQGGPVLVGEHTREILADLGYDDAEILALFEAGAVGDETVYQALAKEGAAVAASPWDPS